MRVLFLGTMAADSAAMNAALTLRPQLLTSLALLVACGGAPDARPSEAAPVSELAVGELRVLDDARLGPEMSQLGVFHAGVYVRTASPGLHLLEPYDAARVPVVFVHGYAGHPQQLETLIESIDAERYQAWVFQYPSGWRIERSARSFDAALEALRAEYGLRDVRVVAHSMGGLVSRAMLRHRMARGAEPLVSSFITLASPLGGMPSAAEGAQRSPMVIASWIDLDPRSPLIGSLSAPPLPEERTRWVLVSADAGGGDGDGTVSLAHQLPDQSVADADRLVRVRATHTGVLASPEVLEVLEAELRRRGS